MTTHIIAVAVFVASRGDETDATNASSETTGEGPTAPTCADTTRRAPRWP